jgi:hypothetical protein
MILDYAAEKAARGRTSAERIDYRVRRPAFVRVRLRPRRPAVSPPGILPTDNNIPALCGRLEDSSITS